jgi:WD40 repeat protein
VIGIFSGDRGCPMTILFDRFRSNRILSAGYDRTIKIWNLDGKCLKTLEEHETVHSNIVYLIRSDFVSNSLFDMLSVLGDIFSLCPS